MDRNPPRRESRLEHRVQAARGSVKKFMGRATDDPRLEARGRRDQFRGNIKQAASKVRDAFKR
ncbi:CsbD family protein [Nocardia higoensis]|uniref:CsbD family protein n=1 Tax=Nocardia higoensis TaxID=228599 RepID=A0ABS0D3T2_9NOCA|nr:CsbD family protein [Nocardia higoensis]MBF6353139.1 CsbD family protein [Nocardia higoensis]